MFWWIVLAVVVVLVVVTLSTSWIRAGRLKRSGRVGAHGDFDPTHHEISEAERQFYASGPNPHGPQGDLGGYHGS